MTLISFDLKHLHICQIIWEIVSHLVLHHYTWEIYQKWYHPTWHIDVVADTNKQFDNIVSAFSTKKNLKSYEGLIQSNDLLAPKIHTYTGVLWTAWYLVQIYIKHLSAAWPFSTRIDFCCHYIFHSRTRPTWLSSNILNLGRDFFMSSLTNAE